jgi:hypothetical protein
VWPVISIRDISYKIIIKSNKKKFFSNPIKFDLDPLKKYEYSINDIIYLILSKNYKFLMELKL